MKAFGILVAIFSSTSAMADACPKEGAVALTAGYAETASEKEVPVVGVSLTYGNYCLGVGGLHLSFGAQLDIEKHLKGADTQSVAAGPAWCFLLPTNTDLCAAYLVRDTTLRDEQGRYDVGDVGPSYALRQNFGALQVSAGLHHPSKDSGHNNTYLFGVGYTPPPSKK